MAVQPDVLELVQVLTEEGFGIVAGDLLAEISRRSDVDGDFNEKIDLGEDLGASQPWLDDDDQLGEALRIIHLRLVEPARHLAEAERIAGSIADEVDGSRSRHLGAKMGCCQANPSKGAIRHGD